MSTFVTSPFSPMPSARMQHRIDPALRRDAEKILLAQGIKPAQAIILFYTEVRRARGLPFLPTPVHPSEVPNKRTQKAIREARKGIGVQSFTNKKDFFQSLHDLE